VSTQLNIGDGGTSLTPLADSPHSSITVIRLVLVVWLVGI